MREPPVDLAGFLRDRREAILSDWESEVRGLPTAGDLSRPALRDHMPSFLDRLAELASADWPKPPFDHRNLPALHSQERFHQGVELDEVIAEYGALRDVILEHLAAKRCEITARQSRVLHGAIDDAIRQGVRRYVRSHDWTVASIECLSAIPLSAPLDDVLRALLAAFVERAPGAAGASFFAKEDEEMVRRASAGTDVDDTDRDLSAGDPLLRSVLETRELQEITDERGTWLALPVIVRDDVAGVTRFRSVTAPAVTHEDRLLFHLLTSRVTAAVAQHRAQASLEHERARTLEIVSALADGVLLADTRGNVVYANASAARLFGMPRDALLCPLAELLEQLDVRDVSGERPRPTGTLARERNESVEGLRRSFRIPGDAARRWIRVSGSPLRDPLTGKIEGSVVVFGDITDGKRAEEELERTAEFRERMLGIVGHDLRNPLASITTAARLLLKTADTDRETRNATRILSSANRMARLIDDLLDFTRSRLGGGIPIRREESDLDAVVRGAIEELQTTHPDRRIALESPGPVRCTVDPERMAQVVSNLVGNALEHGAADLPVSVRLSREGSKDVRLEVHNHGPEIPADLLPQIFAAFRRGQPARNGAVRNGVGLGLYIADQVVRAHGGALAARSAAAEGTTFTVKLPDCAIA